MIEATCAACGTVNRIGEADVPAGSKFLTCSSCKSRVALPAPTARPAIKSVAIPAKLPTPPQGVRTPKLPTPPQGVLPPKATLPPHGVPPAKPPATKPMTPPGGVPPPMSPAARPTTPPPVAMPPRGSATPPGGMPTPKPPAKPAATKPMTPPGGVPPPKLPSSKLPVAAQPGKPTPPQSVAQSSADTLELADLPAPKRSSALAGAEPSKPAPRSALADADLPAPKGPRPTAQQPAVDLDDLMPPAVAKPPIQPGLADLPMPRPRPAPARAALDPLGDLPAPKPNPAAIADLPAPKQKSGGVTDLPAPKAPPAAAKGALDDDLDWAMAEPGINDLPAPKPGANTDLPAPKGFFDDLPQPARASAQNQDVAPKGFFDDLPQPARASAQNQDVAPKGFFDDLPQPARASAQNQDVAPKGFFDDLPQPARASAQNQDVAPKGFFDDLPQPSRTSDAARARNNAADGARSNDLELDLESPSVGLELDGGPDIDIGLPLGEQPQFDDLDLSEPTPKPTTESPIKIKTPKGAVANPIQINVPSAKPPAELEIEAADKPRALPSGSTATKIAPKRPAPEPAEAAAGKRRRTRVAVLASVLVVAGLGAGGFYVYQRHQAQQAREANLQDQLAAARTAMTGSDPNHWQRAAAAANAALEIQASDPHALGLAAEAAIAGALDTGANGPARIAQGRGLIQKALEAGSTGPELERAQAIAAVAAKGQAERATQLLRPLIARAPQDGWLQLYLGWAQLATGDAAEAVKAFEQAVSKTPETKLPALYGQGRAKLVLADIAGAQAAFAAVLQTAKDHVCAQVGLTATLPSSQSSQRDAELRAILARKDIKAVDPRCVVQAHAMIGDVARSAGRLDDARQRYRDALALVPLDVPSLTGLADVELRDGKIAVAADLLQKASAANADDPDVQLLTAMLQIRQGKLPDAQTSLAKLEGRKTLPTLTQARLRVVKGKLLEAQGMDDEAVDQYAEGAKLAGDLDLTPTMLAATKLSDLAKKASDPTKATQYRSRADQLLSALAERAQEDAQLSAEVGTSYLLAGDAAKGENFLRRAVEMRGDDPESRLQLAKAQRALGRIDDAVGQLNEALKLDAKRMDIALELAATYSIAGRDADAVAAYERLLAAPDVPIIVRVNAGRYFAQHGQIEKAVAQSATILKAEPENPGGLYLQAEGLIKAGKWAEARVVLIKATDADQDNAQYLDALGRALEGSFKAEKDSKFVEGARNAYERAAKVDPKLLNALVGQGRMLVARKEWESALAPLLAGNALDKANSEIMYYLGVAYYGVRNQSSKHRQNAADWLRSALAGRPELALSLRTDAWYRLGLLYTDLNKASDAARALDNATRLGEDIEKQTGSAPEWLTETWYDLGDLYDRLDKHREQKRAWLRYVERKPAAGVRLQTANNALATSLQRY